MEKLQVQIKILPGNEDIELPKYMTESSAGLDIEAAVCEETVLKPGEIKLIPTGIALSIPRGYEAQIRPRSGLALKHGITVLNSPGTIDADYRGEIKIILANFGKEDFLIKRKSRIAQMVFNKIEKVDFKLVTKLDDSKRGSKGFGHTGF